MLAINDPALNKSTRRKKSHEKFRRESDQLPENHVKWHWYVEIERVVVANTRHEKHNNQNSVVFEANFRLDSAKLGSKNEAMDGDEEKLEECYQISRTWIGSKNKIYYK
jgi:hypothetical protein